jgi:hypothetical protein
MPEDMNRFKKKDRQIGEQIGIHFPYIQNKKRISQMN